ncbi:MAG: alpha/beta hydrolase-fold protein, partial [Chitinophagales bacterium]
MVLVHQKTRVIVQKYLFYTLLYLPLFFLLSNFGDTYIHAQNLQITLAPIPENTPAEDTLYLAGNFNGWQPNHPDYQFTKQTNGTYAYVFTNIANHKTQTFAFKITRGSWQKVEGNENGQVQPNHLFNYAPDKTQLDVEIKSWEDLFEGEKIPATSTRTKNVQIMSPDFDLPQLHRQRRIWVYLPPDYEKTNKCYPVIYMHDGQNLFDFTTSYSGE